MYSPGNAVLTLGMYSPGNALLTVGMYSPGNAILTLGMYSPGNALLTLWECTVQVMLYSHCGDVLSRESVRCVADQQTCFTDRSENKQKFTIRQELNNTKYEKRNKF